MAVYRCEIKRISRSSGRSSVASAAYRAAVRLHDDRADKTHDYRRKAAGIVHTGIRTRDDAPGWARDRGRLWNGAEAAERRKDANTAREVLVSLPHELDDAQRVELVERFSSRLVERYGVAVDYAIHRPDRRGDDRNHHAHLMMTTRRLDQNGLGEKTRELDDRTIGPNEIQAIRQIWEYEQNRALDHANLNERVSCRSNEAQGLDREPEPKIGKAANALMKRGDLSRLGEYVQQVRQRNSMRVNMARQRDEKKRAAEVERLQKITPAFQATQRGEDHQQTISPLFQEVGKHGQRGEATPAFQDAQRRLLVKSELELKTDKLAARDQTHNVLLLGLVQETTEEMQGRHDKMQHDKTAQRKEDEERQRRAERAAIREAMRLKQAAAEQRRKERDEAAQDRGQERTRDLD